MDVPIIWHRFDIDTFSIGRREHALPGGLSIRFCPAARTLIDVFRVFRLRHTWGSDLALSALKRWLRNRGNSPRCAAEVGRELPEGAPRDPAGP